MSDRLAKRGWSHTPLCQLCRCHDETARHILFECRYSRRIWQAAASWLFCPSLVQDLGSDRSTVLDYWQAATRSPTAHPAGLKSAVTLITWEIWKERNARVFTTPSRCLCASFKRSKMRARTGFWLEISLSPKLLSRGNRFLNL